MWDDLNKEVYDIINKAIIDRYESIYIVNAGTNAYKTYYESKVYSKLHIRKSGADFFAALRVFIPKAIFEDDRNYVWQMLDKSRILEETKGDTIYAFNYRINMDGKTVYHQLRIVMASIGGEDHILMGVCNVDDIMRREDEHRNQLLSLRQREKNHLEAILASAAGYIEANLTKNEMIEFSPLSSSMFDSVSQLPDISRVSYSEFENWFCENCVADHQLKYREISNRDYLLSCFEKGEKRASVLFSARISNGALQPCRKVFYLYRDDLSSEIMAFCIIYDLTSQQKRELELENLEEELKLSRIRNSTGQMKPHFLYNALGSIQEILLDDPAYASELIGDFTKHLRSCVRALSSDDPIRFSSELENIKAYVNIEKMRFGKKLKVVYDTPTVDFAVVPLSIQPLVENAVRHGIYQRGAAGGTVTVSTAEDNGYYTVTVSDNGVGFDVEAFRKASESGATDSTGLKNIIFRMEKMMGAAVDIRSTPGVGTVVTVKIPKGGAKDAHNNS